MVLQHIAFTADLIKQDAYLRDLYESLKVKKLENQDTDIVIQVKQLLGLFFDDENFISIFNLLIIIA